MSKKPVLSGTAKECLAHFLEASLKEAEVKLSHQVIIDSLAAQVKAMLPLARLVAGDNFSPAERRLLREKAEKNGVFHLSRELNRLCGEQARDKFQQQQQ